MLETLWLRIGVALEDNARQLRNREEGQTLVEYALIIALVSVALIGALSALAGGIGAVFSGVVSILSSLPG
jgi:pilus assembly protein Flp/PilA